MVKYTSEYTFEFLENMDELNPMGTILWILNPHKKPPHLGISSHGKYFSLKFNGKDEHVNVLEFFKFTSTRNIPLIAIKLKQEVTLTQLTSAFQQFSKANSLSNSCLKPILMTLKINKGSIEKLTDLLIHLKDEQLIEKSYGSNIKPDFSGIRFYTTDHLSNYLNRINHA